MARRPPSSLSSRTALADAFASSAARALDDLYSRLTRLNGKFFTGGWGDLDLVRIEAAREAAAAVSSRAVATATAAAARGEQQAASGWRPEWRRVERRAGEYSVYEARFESPAADASLPALGGPLLPRESRFARARLVVPDGGGGGGGGSGSTSSLCNGIDALVVHLPATGDHDWTRRTRLALPMAMGVGSGAGAPPARRMGALLLEGAFYGARRPEGQRGAKVRRVADLFVLGWATISEALLLAGWARGESARQGVCGLSMGGVHAAMAAALSPHALAVAPLLAPRSAVAPYVDGALARSVAVEALVGGGGWSGGVGGVATVSEGDDRERRRREEHEQHQQASAAAAALVVAAGVAADSAATAAEAASLPGAGPCLRKVAAAVRAASVGMDVGEEEEEEEGEEEDDKGSRRPLRMLRARRALAAVEELERALAGAEAEAIAAAAVTTAPSGSPPSSSSLPSPTSAAAALASAAAAALRAAAAAAAARTPLLAAAGFPFAASPPSPPLSAADPAAIAAAAGSAQSSLAWAALRAALEAYTDVTRFPVPKRPDAAILLAAKDDAYAPPSDARVLQQHWGCELRIVPGGHVTAFLLQQDAFRSAIADSVARL
jgi:hypothetical protein